MLTCYSANSDFYAPIGCQRDTHTNAQTRAEAFVCAVLGFTVGIGSRKAAMQAVLIALFIGVEGQMMSTLCHLCMCVIEFNSNDTE